MPEASDPRERYLLMAFGMGVAFLPPLAVAAAEAGTLLLYAELARCSLEAMVKFLSWLALRRVLRGETSEYAYGQGKLEHLCSVLVGSIMLIAACFVAYHAIDLFLAPQYMADLNLGFGVTAVMSMTNLFFWRQGLRLARETGSPLMDSKASMYKGRALASTLVATSLGCAVLFEAHAVARYIDPIGSLALCGLTLAAARRVLSQAFSGLLDKALDESLQLLIIRELTTNFDGYTAIHGIRNRRSGSDVFIEIFLEFDPAHTMGAVQATIDAMRSGLQTAIPGSQVSIIPATERVN